jgi:hypothetical protein
MSTHPSTPQTKWTTEMIIDLIRKVRNDLIKDFLDERFLHQYVETNYNIKGLSPVKVEFIKANLKELLITPVENRTAPLCRKEMTYYSTKRSKVS